VPRVSVRVGLYTAGMTRREGWGDASQLCGNNWANAFIGWVPDLTVDTTYRLFLEVLHDRIGKTAALITSQYHP
jgi:hypothetical protein